MSSFGSALSGALQLPVRVSVYANGDESAGKRVVLDRAEPLANNVTRVAKKMGMDKIITKPILFTSNGIAVEESDEIIEGEVLYFEPRGREFIKRKATRKGSTVVSMSSATSAQSKSGESKGDSAESSAAQKGRVASIRKQQRMIEAASSKQSSRGKRANSIEYDLMFKFILVGNSSVGKSCLLLRFTDRRFRGVHEATIGVDFGTETVHLNDKSVKVQIWDTAGQEDFQAITRAYYREAAAALVVYDITSRDSFNEVKTWLTSVRGNSTNKALTVALIGNKSDLESERQVQQVEGATFARESGLLFFETSAKTGENVEEAFLQTARSIMRKLNQGLIDVEDASTGVRLGTSAKERPAQQEGFSVVTGPAKLEDDEDEGLCYCF